MFRFTFERVQNFAYLSQPIRQTTLRKAVVHGLAQREHINLAWATVSFFIGLPVVRPLLQLLADVSAVRSGLSNGALDPFAARRRSPRGP